MILDRHLDIAVRGKIVSQDSSDEPASALLSHSIKERQNLLKNGRIRKREILPPMKESDTPFSIPSSWRWIRLGDLGITQTGTTPPKGQVEHFGSYMPFIKPGDIYSERVDYSNEGLSKIGARLYGRIAVANSIVMVCIGTIGKCQLIDRSCSFNQQINSLSPYTGFDASYLYLAVRSGYFQEAALSSSARTTIAILNKGKWELLPVPIPPLAEQRRIIAKTDQLMKLCDQLAASLKFGQEQRSCLVTASLSEALMLATE